MALVTAHKPMSRSYDEVALATNSWPKRLLASGLVTATTALPGTHELADEVFTEKPFHPQSNEETGLLIWAPRPGTIMELWPIISDADGETVNAMFGWVHPMERHSPQAGAPVQWTYTPMAVMTWTAGSKVGLAGGIVPATHYYADTIAITKALWPEPNPLRLIGPRTSVDDATLLPDNTPVGIQVDILGGALAFLRLDLGTAAGVNVLERSF